MFVILSEQTKNRKSIFFLPTSSTHDTFFHHLSSAFNLIVSIVQYPIARFGGIHLACINDAVSELWML